MCVIRVTKRFLFVLLNWQIFRFICKKKVVADDRHIEHFAGLTTSYLLDFSERANWQYVVQLVISRTSSRTLSSNWMLNLRTGSNKKFKFVNQALGTIQFEFERNFRLDSSCYFQKNTWNATQIQHTQMCQ